MSAVLASIALVTIVACTPPGPTTVELPLIEPLGRGAFLADGWLDLPAIHERQTADGRPFDAGVALALVSGWTAPEYWGVWGTGNASKLVLHTRAEGPFDFAIRAKAPADPAGRAQQVDVEINGTRIGSFDVDSTWALHQLAAPDGVVKPGDNEIVLRYAYHIEGIKGHDDRPLALGVVRAGIVPRGVVDEASLGEPSLKADPTRDALYLLRAGRYVVPYAMPSGAETLSFETRFSSRNPIDPDTQPSLTVVALTLDGTRHPLLELALNDTTTRHTLPIQALRGRKILLAFDARLPAGSTAARIEVRQPHILALAEDDGSATAVVSPTVPSTTARDAARKPAMSPLPDILVLVLDAARADHFGSYGYPRDTTPQLDALAAESFVFRNVVAECPYTVCSSPNFMSGLSFTQHGIDQKGLRLPDEVETLAERLREAGYRTVGYTANPNNASSTGAEQGFDEFHEMWRYFRNRARTHPGPMTDSIRQRIAQGFGDQPAFIFAHYVPPHEPYDPDPEFDVFGDPDYDGPVTGQLEQTRAIFFGKMAIDDADLHELEALYDGNLRQADAWVAKLFDAQREAGRWDNTIVLVTSDHGEAFGEHGEIGHNTTLFREMLDVPFVLRLPESLRPPAVDLDQLASLAAVPSTLLGVLGLHPDPLADGPDLLAKTPATANLERLIPLRTSNPDNPIYGLQSVRWKVMIRYRDQWVAALYDHATDPGETVNRARDEPLLFAGMVSMLGQQLSAATDRAGDAELSAEDEEMLRSLGYI